MSSHDKWGLFAAGAVGLCGLYAQYSIKEEIKRLRYDVGKSVSKKRVQERDFTYRALKQVHTAGYSIQEGHTLTFKQIPKENFEAFKVDNGGGKTNNCLFYAVYPVCNNDVCRRWRLILVNMLIENEEEMKEILGEVIWKEQKDNLTRTVRDRKAIKDGNVEEAVFFLGVEKGLIPHPEANVIMFTPKEGKKKRWIAVQTRVYTNPNTDMMYSQTILIANEKSERHEHFINLVPAQDLSSYVELITALEWQENLKDDLNTETRRQIKELELELESRKAQD